MRTGSVINRYCTRIIRSLAFLSAITLANLAAGQQHASVSAIHFSVVSIRPSDPRETTPQYTWSDDGLTERNNPAMTLLLMAFNLPTASRIEGSPAWLERDRFDVTAKVEDIDLDQFRALNEDARSKLLQQVFRDYFHLDAHVVMRETSEYALKVVKQGPKLTPARAGEETNIRVSGRYALKASNISLQQFCHMVLSTEAQRMVYDDTNIPGSFDIDLLWTRPSLHATTSADSDYPDIFRALKEQLGLQLVEGHRPESYFVIEHIEQPAEL